MSLFLIALLVILIPTVFQIACGSLAVCKKITLPFELVCTIAVFTQLIAIFAGVKMAFIDMKNHDVHCAIPAAAIFVCGLVMSVILLLVIVIQLAWRKFRRRQ